MQRSVARYQSWPFASVAEADSSSGVGSLIMGIAPLVGSSPAGSPRSTMAVLLLCSSVMAHSGKLSTGAGAGVSSGTGLGVGVALAPIASISFCASSAEILASSR